MGDALRIYNLGTLGVNVDKSPVHLFDGELTSAQNAIREPLGLIGGLRKRAGLKKFNATTMSGIVLGGIGLPLPLLASTINGIAFPDEVDGADDGDVGGGGVVLGGYGGPGPVGSGVGSGGGNGGGLGDGGGAVGSGGGGSGGGTGTRTMYLANATRGSSAIGLSHDWWRTVNPSAAGVVATADNPSSVAFPAAQASLGDAVIALDDLPWAQFTGSPAASCVINNLLYYMPTAGGLGSGTVYPVLCTWDGTAIANVGYLPAAWTDAGGTTATCKVMSMLADGTDIYVVIATRVAGIGARGGLIYKIDTLTKTGRQIGDAFLNSNGHIPYSLCLHQGLLFCGSIDRFSGPGKIWSIRPDDLTAVWALDHTMSQGIAPAVLWSFSGELYAGSAVSVTQVIEKRDTFGVWTVDLSITGPGGVSGSFLSGRQFQVSLGVTKLYVAIVFATVAAASMTMRIYERTTAGVWTKRYDETQTTNPGGVGYPVAMFIENAAGDPVLWLYGGDFTFNTNNTMLMTTVDGVTWSVQSAQLPTVSSLTGIATFGELIL